MKRWIHFDFISQNLNYILVVGMIIIALFGFDDYGISTDEPHQRSVGVLTAKYAILGDNTLMDTPDRIYGVAFELPLIALEVILGLEDTREIFLMRHLATHIFFLISAFFCFRLIDFLYKNKFLATIGFLLFVLHPRIYAHSFFNTKDIPFMSMFIISFYYWALAFDKKTEKSFIILGMSVGLLTNIRIMGIMLFGFTCIYLFMEILLNDEKKKYVRLFCSFVFSSLFTLYISWPFLWSNPIKNFMEAFYNMSKYTRWGGSNLINGVFIKGTDIDWTYTLSWLSISTPITYLLLALFGTIALMVSLLMKNKIIESDNIFNNNILYLLSFVSPLVVVGILDSVLYNGWRQMFFIYPPLILLCIYGIDILLHKFGKKFVFIFAIVNFSTVVPFMYFNHPFGIVYFNKLFLFKPDEHIRKNYDYEYWGVSYKKAFEYILELDHSDSLRIAVSNRTGNRNLLILKPEDRKRIKIVDESVCKYFVTNYRYHPQDYESYDEFKLFSFKVNNNSVSSIYKLH